jgi:hypothetical protein
MFALLFHQICSVMLCSMTLCALFMELWANRGSSHFIQFYSSHCPFDQLSYGRICHRHLDFIVLETIGSKKFLMQHV